MNIEESCIVDALLKHADRIGHVHLADNNRSTLSQGCFGWESILLTLNQIGCIGMCSIEAIPGLDPDSDAISGYRYFQKFTGECHSIKVKNENGSRM
jgi:sugar phosphate isomerase/epimerase